LIVIATVLLLLALPFLLWPLLRPADRPGEPDPAVLDPPADGREDLLHQVEELELDLASGRIDRPEADRRLAELRTAAR